MTNQLSLTDTKLIIKMSIRNTEVRNAVIKCYFFSAVSPGISFRIAKEVIRLLKLCSFSEFAPKCSFALQDNKMSSSDIQRSEIKILGPHSALSKTCNLH